MSNEFSIHEEGEFDAPPERMWNAITAGTSAWLFPGDVEPRLGGAAAFGGVVTVWDPYTHFANRVEAPNGWFNELDTVIEPREGGRSFLRYTHSGIFVDNWDTQYDGASKHTVFYLHTLGQYVTFFPDQKAIYASFDAPDSSRADSGFDRLRDWLAGFGEVNEGSRVRVVLDGADPIDAVVDYSNANFIGLRSDNAMYRFFGRNAFGGAPVGMSIHYFGDESTLPALESAWQKSINEVYAA
jgi:hypothetical protein